jgi:hypothetical protein
MTRRVPPTRRKKNPKPMPAHEALAILIAYATEGSALKREAMRAQRKGGARR